MRTKQAGTVNWDQFLHRHWTGCADLSVHIDDPFPGGCPMFKLDPVDSVAQRHLPHTSEVTGHPDWFRTCAGPTESGLNGSCRHRCQPAGSHEEFHKDGPQSAAKKKNIYCKTSTRAEHVDEWSDQLRGNAAKDSMLSYRCFRRLTSGARDTFS